MSQTEQGSLDALASLSLTPREAEVLFWISQGKSNHDIGVILENRTAAAVLALEACRSAAPASDGEHGQAWAAIAGLITTQLCAVWSDSCEFYDEITRLVA